MPSSQWPIYLGTTAGTPMAKLITHAGKQSIFDVADTTERAAVITALAAAGVDTTIVYVHRRDAGAGAELERTSDGGSSWVALRSPIHASLSRSTSQTGVATATTTAVAWAAITGDSAVTWAAGTPSRATIARAGFVTVVASIEFGASTTGWRTLQLRKNGKRFAQVMANPLPSGAGGGIAVLNIAGGVQVAVGDYIECVVWQNSGGTLSLSVTEGPHAMAIQGS